MICPNLSDPIIKAQWDALVNDPKIGKFEAMREFMQAENDNRPIGTPDQVKQKLDNYFKGPSAVDAQVWLHEAEKKIIEKSNDPAYTDPSTSMGLAILENPINTKDLSVESNSKTRGYEIANKLSTGLKIKYAIISPEEAVRITAGSKNKYDATKGPAFFYGDTVYFVGDNLRSNIVFHEFAHPVVRAIQNSNPVLFAKLVDDALAADPSLLKEALDEYEDLRGLMDQELTDEEEYNLRTKYKKIVAEEILVKALEKKAVLKDEELQNLKGFDKFINDLLYAIKQTLRKLFGVKANVAKLSVNTTIDELAQMLAEGGNFEIQTDLVSHDDVVAYYATRTQLLEDMKKVGEKTGSKAMFNMIKSMHDISTKQIRLLLHNKNYRELFELLVDEFDRGDLHTIRGNLAKHVKLTEQEVESAANDFLKAAETFEDQANNLVKSMLKLEITMKKIQEQLKDVAKPENFIGQDEINKAHYYTKFIDYWASYIESALSTMRSVDMPGDSPMMQLLTGIENDIKKSSEHINNITTRGVKDVLWEKWADMAEAADNKFNLLIANLKKKQASQSLIDKRFEEYHGMSEALYNDFKRLSDKIKNNEFMSLDDKGKYDVLLNRSLNGLRMTKEKLSHALKGEGRDTNWGNAYLEGYMYSTDPVLGGFAMYFKNNMTEFETRAQARFNDIVKELQPALEKAGVNFTRIGDLGKQIGFLDKVGQIKNGEFKETEVWTLLSKFKDYRLTVDRFNYEIKKLREVYENDRDEKSKKELIDKIYERDEHNKRWMHQEYVDSFYNQERFLIKDENDELGKQAKQARQDLIKEMQDISDAKNEGDDVLKNDDQMKDIWKRWRLLHSLYNLDGTKKTGLDLQISERLREYNKAVRNFYEYKLRPGAFQEAYKNQSIEIYDRLQKDNKLRPTDPEFIEEHKRLLDEWLLENTRVKIKPTFYEKRNSLLARLKTLLSKLPSTIANEADFAKHYEVIFDATSGFRDDDGQPVGTDMSAGRKKLVKDAQLAMDEAKAKWAGFTGLTKEEFEELSNLSTTKKVEGRLQSDEYTRFLQLLEKRKKGLDKNTLAEVIRIFQELKELQSKHPTVYYVEALNNWLEKMPEELTEELYNQVGIREITVKNVETFYASPAFQKMIQTDKEFDAWFSENHITKTRFDKESKKRVTYVERLYVWNIIKPNDESYYETTVVKEEDGTDRVVSGVPAFHFYTKVVKKEFRTGYDKETDTVKLIVGKHVDNRNEFLPKDIEGSPYRNEKYYSLQASNKPMFDLLEIISRQHLENQKGLSRSAKLYLDFPRFERGTLETLQEKPLSKIASKSTGPLATILRRLKDFWRGSSKELVGEQFNWKEENMLVRMDSQLDQIENIPIQGLFDLDAADVSTNIVGSMFRYMYGAEQQKQLIKMNPMAQALRGILNANPKQAGVSAIDDVNQKNFVNRNVFGWFKKQDKYVRRDAFHNFYEKNFLGQNLTGVGKDNNRLINIQRALFGKASFSFFAFNIPSALKNAIGAKFQATIDAAAGSDINYGSLAKGEAWSIKYMMKLSGSDIYERGNKSLEGQIGEIFDFAQDRFRKKFGDSVTRTLLKDAASTGWFYNFREWTELQATGQLFGGMMYKKKVKQGDKFIDYMDAWELVNGQVTLKQNIDVRYGQHAVQHVLQKGDTLQSILKKYNIDPEAEKSVFRNVSLEAIEKKVAEINKNRKEELAKYASNPEEFKKDIDKVNNRFDAQVEKAQTITIDNTEFKRFRSRIHQVVNKFNGAYAHLDQPEAQRYLLFRMFSFLRRYFTTSFMRRFGKRRWDPGYGEVDEGFYIATVRSLSELMRYRDMSVMGTEEKAALMKVMSELMMLVVLGFMPWLIWGWDDDDEDRYEKLRERSAHMPFPLTADEGAFSLPGFISLQALNLTMQVRAENEQFIPWIGFGLDDLTSMMDLKSLVMGPTVNSYLNLMQDSYNFVTGSDKQFYQRRVGPYEFQQQGGRKFWAHIAKMWGMTGTVIDPATGIQRFQQAKALSRVR